MRVNTLRAQALDLPVPTHPAPGLPEGLVLEAALDVHATDEFARGELMPQSRASMTVARVLDPQPGERVLDLCAAPGAKTTHIAALMEGRGEVVAVESHPGRAKALAGNARRLGAEDIVRVLVADAARACGRDVRPRAARSALLRPRHSAGAAGRALAQGSGADRAGLGPAGGASRRRGGAGPAGRCAGLFDVHDLGTRE